MKLPLYYAQKSSSRTPLPLLSAVRDEIILILNYKFYHGLDVVTREYFGAAESSTPRAISDLRGGVIGDRFSVIDDSVIRKPIIDNRYIFK